TVQQSSYNASYQPQQYQTQTRPPQPQPMRPASDQYSYPAQPSSPIQSDQYGEYSTCPACGGAVQIPPSSGGYPVKVVCPSCGAESIIE
ncbi:MAG: hypothetical protein WC974_07225, partial [Thermoplasmata archaeon]